MTISDVRRQRRRLYRLVLDGEDGPLVDAATFDESPYRVGSTVTPEELEALLHASELNRAREKALYLLGLRDYACGELQQKLAAEVSPEAAATVVRRLKEVGLLDDAAYAVRAARHMSGIRQYPKPRIVQELRRRGIDREQAEQAVGELETEDWQQALALLQKKYYNKLSNRDDRQKAAAALARRGFSYAAVRQAMEAATQQESEELEGSEEWP